MKIKYAFLLFLVPLLLINTNLGVPVNAAAVEFVIPPPVTAADIPDDIYRDSSARLPQVQREDLDAAGRDAFDTYVSPGTGYETGLRGPVGMWMHSPELAQAIFDVRLRVRYGSAKDQRLTELTIIATAREINNQYEYTAHEPAARSAGLEQEIIDIVRFRKPLQGLSDIEGLGETEKVIIQFTREVVSAEKVSSDTFARASAVFGNEGVMDLTGLIGYYSFVAMTLKAFDVQRPVGSELLLPIRVD